MRDNEIARCRAKRPSDSVTDSHARDAERQSAPAGMSRRHDARADDRQCSSGTQSAACTAIAARAVAGDHDVGLRELV